MKHIDVNGQLLTKRADEIAALISGSNEQVAENTLRALSGIVEQASTSSDSSGEPAVSHVCSLLMTVDSRTLAAARAQILFRCAVFYHQRGKYHAAIAAAECALTLSELSADRLLTRRTCNALGNSYSKTADFELSMRRFDRALLISREMNDWFLESAVLANISGLFTEMGLYRDALRIGAQVLDRPVDTPQGQYLLLQCYGNGLFAALRLRDFDTAERYVREGTRLLGNENTDLGSWASFEHYRTLHLIETGKPQEARKHIELARERVATIRNDRVDTLLDLAAGLCEFAIGNSDIAVTRLQALYNRTKKSLFSHDDVLRALIKVYEKIGGAAEALKLVQELVEYTASVKKGKYLRQLRELGVTVQPKTERHDELERIDAEAAGIRVAVYKQRRSSLEYQTAENWAVVAELIDDETGEHCYRVGLLARLLAEAYGCDALYCDQIDHAARLHDLGKIGISHSLLLKPARLDPHEVAIMRQHTIIGADLLRDSTDPVVQMAQVIARSHHEWWSGAGYPDLLRGEKIPLAARICALADVYDALTHIRPYKRAWAHAEAIAEITSLRGRQFDPVLTDLFLVVVERYRAEGLRPVQHDLNDPDVVGLAPAKRRLISATQEGRSSAA
jgi:putative two-component system response regulator